MDVELDPILVIKSRDTKLEAGTKEVLKQLKNYKPIKLNKAPLAPIKLGD